MGGHPGISTHKQDTLPVLDCVGQHSMSRLMFEWLLTFWFEKQIIRLGKWFAVPNKAIKRGMSILIKVKCHQVITDF